MTSHDTDPSRSPAVTPAVTPHNEPGDDLARRAVSAARAQAMHLSRPHPRTDSAWRERAARATRTLAATLGLDPADILAVPDATRLYGILAIPDVLLLVSVPVTVPATGAGSHQYAFIPESGRTDAFLLLLPCPRCREQVPTRRVLSLADLGRSLDAEAAYHGRADTERFPDDPGHRVDCPLHLRRS